VCLDLKRMVKRNVFKNKLLRKIFIPSRKEKSGFGGLAVSVLAFVT